MTQIFLTSRQAELLGPAPEGIIDWDHVACHDPRVLETTVSMHQPPCDLQRRLRLESIQVQNSKQTFHPSMEELINDGDNDDEEFLRLKRKRLLKCPNPFQIAIDNLLQKDPEETSTMLHARSKFRRHHKQKRSTPQKTILESFGLQVDS
jgi:hypothetical protein